jgi:hypothetical protein
MTGRVRSVFSVCAFFSLMIGREARPITVDQTRPVVQGAYWTLTGRWHYRVRSFLQCVRSLCCCALLRLTSASGQSRDQRVWSFAARPVCASSASGRCFVVSRCATGASGQLDQRIRSVGPACLVCATSASGHCFAASHCATGASGQLDQRVRSQSIGRVRSFRVLTGL